MDETATLKQMATLERGPCVRYGPRRTDRKRIEASGQRNGFTTSGRDLWIRMFDFASWDDFIKNLVLGETAPMEAKLISQENQPFKYNEHREEILKRTDKKADKICAEIKRAVRAYLDEFDKEDKEG